MEHTKEPWATDERGYIRARVHLNAIHAPSDGILNILVPASLGGIIKDETILANARRIVACVNACAGISTEKLESKNRAGAITTLVEELVAAEKQRDELQREVTALKSGLYDSVLPKVMGQRDELLAALKQLFEDKSPSYHDCLDDGLAECAWCLAEKAIARAEAAK